MDASMMAGLDGLAEEDKAKMASMIDQLQLRDRFVFCISLCVFYRSDRQIETRSVLIYIVLILYVEICSVPFLSFCCLNLRKLHMVLISQPALKPVACCLKCEADKKKISLKPVQLIKRCFWTLMEQQSICISQNRSVFFCFLDRNFVC